MSDESGEKVEQEAGGLGLVEADGGPDCMDCGEQIEYKHPELGFGRRCITCTLAAGPPTR